MSTSHTTRPASFDEVVKEMDRRGHVIEALEAQIAALATPSPQPAANSGEAEAVKRLKDAVEGECEGLALSDDQALAILTHVALATPSPQPADAVREAALMLTVDEQHALATVLAANVGYDLTPEPPHPDAPGPGAFEAAAERALAASGGDTAVVTTEDLRTALTEPAPAGEAVEPVAPVAWAFEWAPLNHEQWQLGVSLGEPLIHWRRYRNIRPLYSHPAPEDTARLREALEPGDPNLWHFWNEKARWLAAKLATTERERDDARKALSWLIKDTLGPDDYSPRRSYTLTVSGKAIIDAQVAARSASREATR